MVLTGISVCSICCGALFVTQGIDEGAEFDEDFGGCPVNGSRTPEEELE